MLGTGLGAGMTGKDKETLHSRVTQTGVDWGAKETQSVQEREASLLRGRQGVGVVVNACVVVTQASRPGPVPPLPAGGSRPGLEGG